MNRGVAGAGRVQLCAVFHAVHGALLILLDGAVQDGVLGRGRAVGEGVVVAEMLVQVPLVLVVGVGVK